MPTEKFTQGTNPYRTLNIGYTDYVKYVELFLKRYKLNHYDFWDQYYEISEYLSKNDLIETSLSILENTPIDYQIDFILPDLEEYIDSETGKEIDLNTMPKTNFDGFYNYATKILDKFKLNIDNFWEEYFEIVSYNKKYEIVEMNLEILKETPLEYQIEWIKSDLEQYIEENS